MNVRQVVGRGEAALNVGLWVFPDPEAYRTEFHSQLPQRCSGRGSSEPPRSHPEHLSGGRRQ